MRPPSSQQANRSGVGLDANFAVAVGVLVAVGLGCGVGEAVVVEATVGLLVSVEVAVITGPTSAGGSATQDEISHMTEITNGGIK
jgi:hypothetical protein